MNWETISGISNAIMAATTLFAMWIGWRGLNAWKEQKRVERDTDLARRAITEADLLVSSLGTLLSEVAGLISAIEFHSTTENPIAISIISSMCVKADRHQSSMQAQLTRLKALLTETDASWNTKFLMEFINIRRSIIISCNRLSLLSTCAKENALSLKSLPLFLEWLKTIPSNNLMETVPLFYATIITIAREHISDTFDPSPFRVQQDTLIRKEYERIKSMI